MVLDKAFDQSNQNIKPKLQKAIYNNNAEILHRNNNLLYTNSFIGIPKNIETINQNENFLYQNIDDLIEKLPDSITCQKTMIVNGCTCEI